MTSELVRRGSVLLPPDPRRVIARLFLPGQETLSNGTSRADAVINRVLAMTDEQVATTLAETIAFFDDRHQDLRAVLLEHSDLITRQLTAPVAIDRRELLGAYFTQEFAVEAAALFNPSIVAHPDQAGLAPGELRFVMSVRAVGEGHISSIEFRTGVLSADAEMQVDDPGRHLATGRARPAAVTREFLAAALADLVEVPRADYLLNLLPERFDADDLDEALARVGRNQLTRASNYEILIKIRWILSCNYRLEFDVGRPISERVIFPFSSDESHGIEDARFTRFRRDDGSFTYRGTYTAYDGANIAPHLLETEDFAHFEITQLIGPAAKNKGMALFPRPVNGRYLALTRWDRESIGLASSPDAKRWSEVRTVQRPGQDWDIIQLGNCGPPIETEQGWLVLTHGVGPMRVYGIGAILLDLDDPSRLLGALERPLLLPDADERDGYVPNVVYSCGGLVHGDTLVLPYGCSDSSIRVAYVELAALLERLLEPGLRQ